MTRETPVVIFDHVSKRFRRRRADTLAEQLAITTRRLFGGAREAADNRFWALHDVSFSVAPGEALGIIGANGAGKSTVLRLLTGLLHPDGGRVDVRGRIGALIELAAGFHPDLTGRENVFLQGAVMGLSRADVRRRFDEIIAFAGVEGFVDTPIKYYSSGMHARLGFSVAAHCEPDVLLIDEVLGVGDRAFQERAFARLEREIARGMPVVVVSHQLDRVARLCRRGLLLSGGTVALEGTADECVAAYVNGTHLVAHQPLGDCPIWLGALTIVGETRSGWRPGTRLSLQLEVGRRGGDGADVSVGVRVSRIPDETLVATVHRPIAEFDLAREGASQLPCALTLNLGPGVYRVQSTAWKTDGGVEWHRGESLLIEVVRQPGMVGDVWLDPDFGVPRQV